MRYLISALGVIASAVVVIISAFMNYSFGYSLGKTPFDAQLYASISVCLDLFKWTLPFFIAWHLQKAHYLKAIIATSIFIFTIGYSLTSSIGFGAANRGLIQAEVQVEKDLYNRSKAMLEENTQRLNAVNGSLAGYATTLKKRGYLYKSERKHRDKLLTESKQLKKEINDYLSKIRFAFVKIKKNSSSGEQLKAFEKMTGFEQTIISMILIGLLAVMVELIAAFGPYVSASPPKKEQKKKLPKKQEREQLPAPIMDRKVSPPNVVELPKMNKASPSVGGFIQLNFERIKLANGEKASQCYMTSSELFSAYKEAFPQNQISRAKFCKALPDIEIDGVKIHAPKISGKRFYGVKRRSEKVKSLRG